MNPATQQTRSELREKIEATVAHILSRAGELTAEAVAAEVHADAEELAVRGFEMGLCAALGPAMGAHVLADLTGHADTSDARTAAGMGLTRAAVSKTLIRVRRNLGLPPRVPKNARPHLQTASAHE